MYFLIEMQQLTNLQNKLIHVIKFLGGAMTSERFISKLVISRSIKIGC